MNETIDCINVLLLEYLKLWDFVQAIVRHIWTLSFHRRSKIKKFTQNGVDQFSFWEVHIQGEYP